MVLGRRAVLVKRPEDGKWSSMAEYAGASGEERESVARTADLAVRVFSCGLRSDRVPLPMDLTI